MSRSPNLDPEVRASSEVKPIIPGTPKGRVRWGTATVLLLTSALLVACASSGPTPAEVAAKAPTPTAVVAEPARAPRSVTVYPDESFRTITKDEARERAAKVKAERPDCYIETTAQGVDAELAALKAKRLTYNPLPLPPDAESRSQVEQVRSPLVQGLAAIAESIMKFPTPLDRARETALAYRYIADDETTTIKKGGQPPQVRIELLDLGACHSAKVMSLLSNLVINGFGPFRFPTPGKI